MQPRERVLAAIRHEQPDRVPYHIELTIEARRRLAQFLGDPDFEQKLGNHMAITKALAPGFPLEIRPDHFEDEFGVVWDRSRDITLGLPRPIFSGPDMTGYAFPDPDDPGRYTHLASFFQDHPEKFRVVKLSHTLFERAWSFRGFQEFLTDLYLYPAFVQEMLERITEFNLKILDNLRPFEVDAIFFGDDWAAQSGLLFSRDLWRQFIKPRMRQLFDRVHSHGWTVILHCCGAVEELLPELIEMGLDVFNPFQPEVMDVYRVKREYGDKLSFFGGLSIQRLLPFGSPEDVRRETRRMIAEVGRQGGFILAPAHALPGDVPPENLLAMIEAGGGEIIIG